MTATVLFESRGPHAGTSYERALQDAACLAASGEKVELVLIDNGVLGILALTGLDAVRSAGVSVSVDRNSMEARGMTPDDACAAGLTVVEDADLASLLTGDVVRAVWH